ncbi:TetR/AcrR family transcriptional regulator [Paenibacillus doosanensis]|uniref:Fatty acid metabolism regulator protein n=1 Tax=Paenibacillus konkukensis TaxID=2020716 RepID=A0ABY4RNW8_9BACL|nr:MULTISPECIES: TetR/AcrR family transcriptional regulator [Paenibacillus]MCS7462581.1 TetR/AcrR family transcriptional regulator [Paenibacillus doosanensis]UQZ83129.1 Fatty acid metabolism regulator protein [Paenibacillus konkukensis]
MGEDKKNNIVEAALKLFEEQGYHQTKVSDIVREAGVAQGTFYLYFQSKEDLFRSIAEACLEEISEALKHGPHAPCQNNEVYYWMIQRSLTVYYHNRAILSIMYRNGIASQEIRDISQAFYHEMMLIIKEHLKEWGGCPDYSEEQLEIAAYSKIGMVEMVAYQWFVVQGHGPEYIDSIAQVIVDMDSMEVSEE